MEEREPPNSAEKQETGAASDIDGLHSSSLHGSEERLYGFLKSVVFFVYNPIIGGPLRWPS
jgi:hypothetical protein